MIDFEYIDTIHEPLELRKVINDHNSANGKKRITRNTVLQGATLDILESAILGMTISKMRVLYVIAFNIIALNHCFVTKKYFEDKLGYNPKYTGSLISQLEKDGSIVVLQKPSRVNSQYHIKLAPWWGWRGDSKMRRMAISDWLRQKRC